MAEHSAATGFNLSNGMYDFLRQLVEKVFPGLGVLYFALADLWNLPAAPQVVGTFTALAVFGGALLSLSRKGYTSAEPQYDGELVKDASDPENVSYRFSLDTTDPEAVLSKKHIVFKGLDSV